MRYWEEGEDQVKFDFELKEIGTGILIGTTSTNYPIRKMSSGVSLKPDNFSTISPGMEFFKSENVGAFELSVWPDKGEGAVYREGEKVIFHFRANKDCYVYLYHMDSSGMVNVIFPNGYNEENFIKANRTYSIPSSLMNFDFIVVPPFGSEMIKAIATQQQVNLDVISANEVFKSMGNINNLRTRGELRRSIELIPKEDRTETSCAITTMGNYEK
ncbi:hypothetical protein ES703_119737 [subsurface metagenome]